MMPFSMAGSNAFGIPPRRKTVAQMGTSINATTMTTARRSYGSKAMNDIFRMKKVKRLALRITTTAGKLKLKLLNPSENIRIYRSRLRCSSMPILGPSAHVAARRSLGGNMRLAAATSLPDPGTWTPYALITMKK